MEMNVSNLAVFIDYENIHRIDVDIKQVLNTLKEKGRLLIKRAYADWGRFPGAKQSMLKNTVDTIELPSYRGRQKNSSDIKLTVDALETALRIPYIDTIVIISSDSDYIPLLSKLRELNKYTVVMGAKKNMSNLVKEYCDNLIYLQSEKEEIEVENIHTAYELLTRAINSIESQGITITSSRAKEQMLRMDASFSEKNYGFAQFKSFIEKAKSDNIIDYKNIGDGQLGIWLGDGKPTEIPDFPRLSKEAIDVDKILRKEHSDGGFLPTELHYNVLQLVFQKLEQEEHIKLLDIRTFVTESLSNLSNTQINRVLRTLIIASLLNRIEDEEGNAKYSIAHKNYDNFKFQHDLTIIEYCTNNNIKYSFETWINVLNISDENKHKYM